MCFCPIDLKTEEPPPGRIRGTELSVKFRKEIILFYMSLQACLNSARRDIMYAFLHTDHT